MKIFPTHITFALQRLPTTVVLVPFIRIFKEITMFYPNLNVHNKTQIKFILGFTLGPLKILWIGKYLVVITTFRPEFKEFQRIQG